MTAAAAHMCQMSPEQHVETLRQHFQGKVTVLIRDDPDYGTLIITDDEPHTAARAIFDTIGSRQDTKQALADLDQLIEMAGMFNSMRSVLETARSIKAILLRGPKL